MLSKKMSDSLNNFYIDNYYFKYLMIYTLSLVSDLIPRE